MKSTRYGIVVLVAGLIAAAPDDTEKEKKKDADVFKGTWAMTGQAAGGKSLDEGALQDFRVKFDGKFYVQSQGERSLEEGRYEIDPEKMPKTIDFAIEKGPDTGKKQLGIYELDGETLKFCVSVAGSNERPKALEAKAGTTVMLFTFKKMKD